MALSFVYKRSEERMIDFNEDHGDEYEHCVRCKRQLSIKRSTHIDMRPEYIIGAGDLCYECYRLIQVKTEK